MLKTLAVVNRRSTHARLRNRLSEGVIMADPTYAAGLAALAICESTLLSLTENGLIDAAEAKAILTDAAVAHRAAERLGDGAGHAAAAALIEGIIRDGNAVRRHRPVPDEGTDTPGP
jgi:hypothetical protein